MDPQKEMDEIEALAKEKAGHALNFLWLVIAAFLLVGSFTSMREQAALGMVIFTICWMFNQVIGNGIAATKALFFSKKSDSNNNNKEQ